MRRKLSKINSAKYSQEAKNGDCVDRRQPKEFFAISPQNVFTVRAEVSTVAGAPSIASRGGPVRLVRFDVGAHSNRITTLLAGASPNRRDAG